MIEVPPALREFLDDHVENLEELEVLVLLAREPERTFTPPEVEQKVAFPSSSFSAALQKLCERGLCEVVGDARGCMLTRRPTLRACALEVANLYESDQFAIIKLVSEAAMQRIRGSMGKAFADAFLLGRKKKRDG